MTWCQCWPQILFELIEHIDKTFFSFVSRGRFDECCVRWSWWSWWRSQRKTCVHFDPSFSGQLVGPEDLEEVWDLKWGCHWSSKPREADDEIERVISKLWDIANRVSRWKHPGFRGIDMSDQDDNWSPYPAILPCMHQTPSQRATRTPSLTAVDSVRFVLSSLLDH